jgi:hypothetical protein
MEHEIFLESHGTYLYVNPRVASHIYGVGVHRLNDTGQTQLYPKNDPDQEYKINSLGYRSKEFKRGTPLLVAGCSYTYGAGLPEDATWGAQLAERLDLEYSNLSRYGGSVPWIVGNVLAYCREFGSPEHIVCAFPNLLRGQVVTDQSTITVNKGKADHNHPYRNDVQSYLVGELDSSKRPKISKRPHEIDDVLTPETAVLYSVEYIRMLEQYCEAAGINLIWSMLEGGPDQHIRTLPERYRFNNYADLSLREFNGHFDAGTEFGFYHNDEFPDKVGEVCHQEELERWGRDSWLLGTDRGHGMDSAHPGVHMSVHWADGFYKEFMRRQEQG